MLDFPRVVDAFFEGNCLSDKKVGKKVWLLLPCYSKSGKKTV